MPTTTARKPAAAAKTPAPAPTPTPGPDQPKVKPLTRPQLIVALMKAGYPEDGPLSYRASDLALALDWFRAGGGPDDVSIPAGIRYAVHPASRPTRPVVARRTARRPKQYLAALTDLRALMTAGQDLKALAAHIDGILAAQPVKEDAAAT